MDSKEIEKCYTWGCPFKAYSYCSDVKTKVKPVDKVPSSIRNAAIADLSTMSHFYKDMAIGGIHNVAVQRGVVLTDDQADKIYADALKVFGFYKEA